MSIIIRDAVQSDLDFCRANPLNSANKGWPNYHLNSWAKTVVVDGDIIGCGGCVYVENRLGNNCIFSGKPTGIGECWLQLSKFADNHKVESVRCLQKLADKIFEELGIWRLEATQRDDFAQSQKMVEMIGFKKERLMVGYSPDGGSEWLYVIEREVRIEV